MIFRLLEEKTKRKITGKGLGFMFNRCLLDSLQNISFLNYLWLYIYGNKSLLRLSTQHHLVFFLYSSLKQILETDLYSQKN